MEKIIKNVLSVAILFPLLLLSSCYASPHRIIMPTESFGMVRHSMLLKICQGKECKIKTSTSTSSGSFFARSRKDSDYSFFLTAGHSCAKPTIPKFKTGPTIELIGTSIAIVDENLNRMPADVIRVDKDNDLCVLKVLTANNDKIEYLDIANFPPSRGERIYNMAAPYGYFGRETVLLFEGFFAGRPSLHESVYSLPTRPGSSGSPILNSSMQIVGLVYAGVEKLENLSIASPHDSILMIVEDVLKEDRDVYEFCILGKCFIFYRR